MFFIQKTNFEQIFSAPFLIELLLVEIGSAPEHDLFFRLHFDGSFHSQAGGIVIAASQPDAESAAQKWLCEAVKGKTSHNEIADLLLQAWWCLTANKSFESVPSEEERRKGWRESTQGKTVELGWLARKTSRLARYEPLTLAELDL